MRSSYLYEIKYCTWTLIVVDDGRDYTRVRLQSSFIDTLTKHRRMFSDIIPNLRGLLSVLIMICGYPWERHGYFSWHVRAIIFFELGQEFLGLQYYHREIQLSIEPHRSQPRVMVLISRRQLEQGNPFMDHFGVPIRPPLVWRFGRHQLILGAELRPEVHLRYGAETNTIIHLF